VKDSAGTERTIEDIQKSARATARQMGDTEVLDVLVDEVGGWDRLPDFFTRCDCHGLWYDQCEAYR
jgi:hypothetical protein